jgi:uncharacterized protein
MSQPFSLYRLQQIDSTLDKAKSRLNQVEALLADNQELILAQEAAAEKENALAAARKSLKRAEEEVAAQQIKIEQNASTLYGGRVRNPKELQDLQNESAALKRYLSVLEDRQLECMVTVEEAEEEYEQTTALLREVEEKVGQEQVNLQTEKNTLEKEIERFSSERGAAAGSISPEDYQLYEQLRRTRMGVAVARVTDRSCSACGSTLTPATVQLAQSKQLTRCTFCGRILYVG